MFVVLGVLAIVLSSYLIARQKELITNQIHVAVAYERVGAAASDLRDDLYDLESQRMVGNLKYPYEREIQEHLTQISHSLNNTGDAEAARMFGRISEKVNVYLGTVLLRSGDHRAYPEFDQMISLVSTLSNRFNDKLRKFSDRLSPLEDAWVRRAALLLALFIFGGILGARRIVATVTGPVGALVDFLERLDPEDPPAKIPHFKSSATEIDSLSTSFERLLERLRGYHSLNLHKFLVEKRRADLVAAAISEGIFLMRGEEVIYVNPVGQRILRTDAKGTLIPDRKIESPVNLRRDFMDGAGARAVLAALGQTMPVEFSLEGKHYLIQAQSVPDELIDAQPALHDSLERVIERFRPTALVLAQDITLVREGQEAKSHFLGTLSHEIKTPVTSLTMATRLLMRSIASIPGASQRALIETSAKDVDRLRILLDELLKVTAFDTLTQKLQRQRVDISKLVKTTAQSFQVQARERDLTLCWKTQVHEGCEDNISVLVDPAKVAWALSNILTNALRHTPRGGTVQVLTEVGQTETRVTVKDTGAGIDEQRQSKIFEKFSAHYNIRVARTGGAGFGLAIAREIVLAHGGRIWVVSAPGAGAEFVFTLPVAHEVEALTHSPERLGSRDSMEVAAGSDGGGIRKNGGIDGAHTSSG